jgi:hypothetical protein
MLANCILVCFSNGIGGSRYIVIYDVWSIGLWEEILN